MSAAADPGGAFAGRRALITGITGQDGSYLADFLLGLGYEVHGLVRRAPYERQERIEHIRRQVRLHQGDLHDAGSVAAVLRAAAPDEIYHLAASSSVVASWSQPTLTADVTATGTARLLEAVRETCPGARLFHASSAEMFGPGHDMPQSERTPLTPRSPYGAAKAHAHALTIAYRETHGLHACCGILYNHESPRRGLHFVTRKISWHAAAMRLGVVSRLRLGNLEGQRDWGFAMDYVRAMWLMLQQDEPEEFVIATGAAHSVRECLQIAFDHARVPIEGHVEVNPQLLRAHDPDHLVGDASKATRVLGWQPEVSFRDLIEMMVDADHALLRFQTGAGG